MNALNTETFDLPLVCANPIQAGWHIITAAERHSLREHIKPSDDDVRVLAAMLLVNELHMNIRHVISYAGQLSGLTIALALVRRALGTSAYEVARDVLQSGGVSDSFASALRLVRRVDERIGF